MSVKISCPQIVLLFETFSLPIFKAQFVAFSFSKACLYLPPSNQAGCNLSFLQTLTLLFDCTMFAFSVFFLNNAYSLWLSVNDFVGQNPRLHLHLAWPCVPGLQWVPGHFGPPGSASTLTLSPHRLHRCGEPQPEGHRGQERHSHSAGGREEVLPLPPSLPAHGWPHGHPTPAEDSESGRAVVLCSCARCTLHNSYCPRWHWPLSRAALVLAEWVQSTFDSGPNEE